MKIAFITVYDALDVGNWSGSAYYMSKSLAAQQNLIDYIGNLALPKNPFIHLKRAYYKFLSAQEFDVSRSKTVAKHYSIEVNKRVSRQIDLLFSPGTIPTAYVDTHKPKVIYTDATFAGMIGFYDSFSNFCSETIRDGHQLEQRALDTSSLNIFSSHWAAQTAIDSYKIDNRKVKVVPFGANLSCNRTSDDISEIIKLRSRNHLNLLFLGVDWYRKGGDRAVRIAQLLNQAGIKTTLHIAGIKNNSTPLPSFVVNHGFISKKSRTGLEKIEQLFSYSHFLLLPTKADCTPVVISESGSFGLPCIAADVGGISSIISNGVNGCCFSLTSDDALWVEYIETIFTNETTYNQLCKSSFSEYEMRLNWNVAGKSVMNLINEL